MRRINKLFLCVTIAALAVSAEKGGENVRVDGIDTVNAVDTVNTAGIIDTSANSKANLDPKLDSAALKLSGTYVGFGLGLSFGEIPIFTMWENSFPDTLQRFGLSTYFEAYASDDPDVVGDTARLLYRITKTPDKFNFAVPFALSLHSINERRIMSLAVSFFRNSKQYLSEIVASAIADTSTRRVSMLETLNFYSVSVEAAGQWAIPTEFFSVNGVQQSLLSLALGASPINTFTRKGEVKVNTPSGDARMQAVADSAQKKLTALSGNGLSLSWRAGINTIKRYPSGKGLELGLFYSGSYSNYFYSDGERLTEEHIKARGVDAHNSGDNDKKPLSFVSHRAEFRVSLLIPAKRVAKDE